MAFNIGDFVQRTTGGPKMTVVAIDGETLVCSWNELGKSSAQRCRPAMWRCTTKTAISASAE